MSNTVYIQPVFVPNQEMFEKNITSIQSFIKCCETNNIKVDCIFGGWGKEEYIEKIVKELSSNFKQINILNFIKFDKNYGKAVIVNHLYKCITNTSKKEYTYILTADSDIIFKADEHNFIERLENCVSGIEQSRKMPFGMMSLNQLEDCRHLKQVFDNQISINNEVYMYPNIIGGIAGGCLFISKRAWDKVGGYRVMGVYSGDDGYLLYDLSVNGFSCGVMKSINIVHPIDNDDEYNKWKDEKLNKCRNENGMRYSDVSSFITDADVFWGKHK